MLFTIAVLWVKFSPAPYAPLLFWEFFPFVPHNLYIPTTSHFPFSTAPGQVREETKGFAADNTQLELQM